MNILEPLCMDKRTKEHIQTYVIMDLCLKEQENIFKPLCVDKRTEEHNQTYVTMYLCLKRTDEHTRTFMYGQKNKRT